MDSDLLALRREMDDLNRTLRDTIQARARLAARIADHKRARGLAMADPEREEAMLRASVEGAPPGFEPEVLAALMRAIFAASRDLVTRRHP
jgi:chorismate mutase